MNTFTSISEIAKHFQEIQPRPYTLTEAIKILETKFFKGQTVTAIQFEDGSGYKFNVQINGGKWQFINLNK